MPEPSGDTPPNPPAGSPPEAGTTPQSSVTRAPRANPPSVYNPKDVPKGSGAPPGFAEFMAWMQSMGDGETAAPETLTGRALIPKEQKKFSRQGAAAAAEPAPAGTPGSEGSPVAAPAAGTGGALPAAPLERVDLGRRRRSKEAPPRSPVVMILLQLLLFGLILGSFFLGRATVPKAAVAPMVPPLPVPAKDAGSPGVLPAELQAKVTEALQAEGARDYKHAEALLQEVQQQGGQVYGLTHELALLAYSQGDLSRVLPLLNQSIAKGEDVGACYNLRGTLVNRTGGISKGIGDLELSAQLAPFEARYAFFAGEALRRTGKPQAAVEYLRRAVDSLQEPLLEGFYHLKLDLARLDSGREKEVTDELTAKLALDPPAVDTLFTAAAVELHRGKNATAAGYLDRARTLVTQEEMNLRLRDYYFFGFNQDKELARFFTSLNTSLKAPPAAGPSPAAGPTATPISFDLPVGGTSQAP